MAGSLGIPMLPDSRENIEKKGKRIKHKVLKTKLDYKQDTGKTMRGDPAILIGDVQKGNIFDKIAVSFHKKEKFDKFVEEHSEDILEIYEEGKGKSFFATAICEV